jgi:alkylmercury lyase
MSGTPEIGAVVAHLEQVFPALDPADQRLSLALYRELARGAPVAVPVLASLTGLAVEEVDRRLRAWPGVVYDDAHRVVGYWGLTISHTAHRLRIGGRDLYTWCAWDTLFLPELLGANAEVRSVCRGSSQLVELTVGASAIESKDPATLWVSFLLPDTDAMRANLVASFCHYVHFFSSHGAARMWLDEHPGTFLLGLDEAHELGRRRNRLRYGDLLAFA